LFGDVHDPDSEVSRAIAERGGYTLMPELGTQPANHYLPRSRTEAHTDPQQVVREANPLRIEGREPATGGAPLGGEWEH
jgi:sulfite dehydrogenase (quinone) subunit SoeB